MATDAEMLRALLSDERLSDEERDIFQDMQDGLRPGKTLKPKQHSWVQDRWSQLELDSDETLNLMSSGKVPRGKEVAMNFATMPKPLKPPRRIG